MNQRSFSFAVACVLLSLGFGLRSEVLFGQKPASGKPTAKGGTAGKFGLGWDAARGGVYGNAERRFGSAPLTAECWVRLPDAGQEHVFVAHGLQSSGDHWELGTHRDSGFLFASLAGAKAVPLETTTALADGKWHFVAMIWGPDQLKLFVDHSMVATCSVEPNRLPVQPAAWAIGTRPDEKRTSSLHIDDVRVSSISRDLVDSPELPLARDAHTLSLYDFESTPEDYRARWTPGGETNQRHLPYPHRIAEFEFEDDTDWVDGRWQETLKGPFLSHSFLLPGYEMGAKLIAQFLPNRSIAIFDTRACSVTAVVRDAELKINPARFGLLQKPEIRGEVLAHVPPRKSWMVPDPSMGWKPVANADLNYQALHLHGCDMVLSYLVQDVAVMEHSRVATTENLPMLVRRLELGPTATPLLLTLAQTDSPPTTAGPNRVVFQSPAGNRVWLLTKNSTSNVRILPRESDVTVQIQPSSETTSIEIYMQSHPNALTLSLPSFDEGADVSLPFSELLRPVGGRWGTPLVTAGVLGADDGKMPYRVDDLTIPFANPFKALFLVSGLDFFPNGDAAICTAHGDVWIVKGITADLSHVTWQRFATGLYQPLGLKVIEGQVVVLGRDQLTRLEDVNEDGEADIYHSRSHDLSTQGQDHAYAMRLEEDSKGNLYFLKSSEGPPHGCSLLRLPKGESTLEVVATGFRHPYGLGIGPHDEITVADNEGNWVPSSKIDQIVPGGYYGYVEQADETAAERLVERPLCYLPKFVDNSCGGQVWVPTDRWGGYSVGEMLHLSWGRCTLHAVLRQTVGNVQQAATVKFPDIVFRSGSGVGKFHPSDGQLYVVGLDGWQTGAVQDGCFQRVQSTGRPVRMPAGFAAYSNGLWLQFAADLPTADSVQLQARDFEVEQWNYRRSDTYGSFHYRPSQPEEIGHDPVAVRSVHRIDARTLFILTDELRPVDQIQLVAQVATAEGDTVRHEILGTINALPGPFAVEPSAPRNPFARENLVAWCIVPFDAAHRGPEQRAAMLQRLGLRHFAYDWREEHVASWDAEVAALAAHHIELTAFWTPISSVEPLKDLHWQKLLQLVDRHALKMQWWIMLDEGLLSGPDSEAKVQQAIELLVPVADAASQRQCRIDLYNHGGWIGEPENMTRVVSGLRARGNQNVGIVYNFHHGHGHVATFGEKLALMRDYLDCVNLNGMAEAGPQIMPIGSGDQEIEMLRLLRSSGYQGRIGILGHREELDAEKSLGDNIEGLERVLAR